MARIGLIWIRKKNDMEVNRIILGDCLKVMGGFAKNSTRAEDMRRVVTIRDLGVSPFVMKYNKDEPYQRAFAGWVNKAQIFNTVSWKDYKYRC